MRCTSKKKKKLLSNVYCLLSTVCLQLTRGTIAKQISNHGSPYGIDSLNCMELKKQTTTTFQYSIE